jgi:hypothetical protein
MRDVHRIARWALLLAVALVPLLMASPALAGTFVYADSNEIYVLELDRPRGDLTTESPWWPQRDLPPSCGVSRGSLQSGPG